jgi:ketosteroid isomerase-like protein
MSQENVEIVLAAFRFFEIGDMEGVLSLADEDVVVTQSVELPGVSPRQYGHEGVLEAFGFWPEQWDDFGIDVLRSRDLGDRVLVETMQRGRGKQSGVEVEMHFSFVFTVRAGKITEWQIFTRGTEALKAVGLAE